ncbi:hypothetical protein Tco_1327854 [Tanacetum coccineum]
MEVSREGYLEVLGNNMCLRWFMLQFCFRDDEVLEVMTDGEAQVNDYQSKLSNNDRNDDDDDDNDSDDDDDNDGNDDDDSDQERNGSNRDEISNLNQFNEEHEEENVDEFTDKEDDEENEEESDDGEEQYKDVTVNLRIEDIEMTDVYQGGADQHNVSQESGFEQEEEDAYVTLTTVHDTQKTEGPMQSSFVSSDFTEKLLNFENIPPADNEIASLMDTTIRTEEPSSQTSTLFTEYIDLVDSSMRTIIREEVKTQLPYILPKAVSDFATPMIEQNVIESLEAGVLARSSSQPKSTYKVATSVLEYKLMKILLDKMKESKSHFKVDYKRKLYDALVESLDNKDKDQDPSAGLDRGTKRRKSSKEAESPKDQRSKEGKSSNSSKGTSRSHHKSSGKYAHAKEPSNTVDDSRVQKNPKFKTGKPYPFDLHKPLPLIPDHQGRQVILKVYFINNDLKYLKGGSLSRRYSTSVTKTKAATYEINWIEDIVSNIWSPVKIEVRREDQQLYTFKEGDFLRLLLQDIEDMLLLLVQQRLNLRNRTAYTAYSDPQGVIYKDKNNRNRLMCTDELHKFSDGTLNDVLLLMILLRE